MLRFGFVIKYRLVIKHHPDIETFYEEMRRDMHRKGLDLDQWTKDL